MAKTITFTYDGAEYTLEFTRRAVERMEERGFNPDDIRTKPVSTLPALFSGAFIAHHPFVKQEKVNAIFEKLTGKNELFAKLGEMYADTLESLMDEPEESEGNVKWGASW